MLNRLAMHSMRFHLALLIAAVSAVPAGAQVQPPTRDSLDGITARGRALVEHDRAAWHATDAVLALQPAPGEILAYLAMRQGSGWVVAFGRPDSISGNFHIAYEAVQSPGRPDSFTVTRHAPARVDSGEFARAARAFVLARADMGIPERPYNTAVLPAADSGWFVYLMPAQTQHGVFPLGGDVRYHVSPDGRRILLKRQLHKAILEMGYTSDTLPAPLFSTHAAILDNVPEDTDVFFVIVRQPRIHHLIVTDAFLYRLVPTGEIVLLGRREDMLGRDSTP